MIGNGFAIHYFIEEQAVRTPGATALVCGEQRLTYAELDARSTQMAHHLMVRNVGPETRIGICMTRSPEMLIGMLGILKAGGAYVPLDPAHPRDRKAFILEDARVPIVLTQHELVDSLPVSRAEIMCLDEMKLDAGVDRGADGSARGSALRPDNLAYVLYTSGSTGTPKGVMVSHRNVASFFRGMDEVLGRGPGVWLAMTSIAFDISVLELLWTLARGFRVILLSKSGQGAGVSPGGAVAEAIQRHAVTHLQCTPSQAAMWVEQPETVQALRRLKQLFIGGEALPPALARRLMGCDQLFNLYGPTETTVWSTAGKITDPNDIHIGRPLCNTRVYVVDSRMRQVTSGEPGELVIGGEGVARGYLNLPKLTAQRFVSDTFEDGAGSLFRTGDLVRMRQDGWMEYLGRMDRQIKLRGHRVEPGEIEAALAEHPLVRQAAVRAVEYGTGDMRLVAYIEPRVAGQGAAALREQLRQHLKCRLPEIMVPGAFVFLERLPLTPNGKLDRSALPVPSGRREAPREGAFDLAGTALERLVAGIWRELLKVDPVGLHENFFDLGGHSMLLTQVQARLRQELGYEISELTLFQYPTVAELAAYLGGAHREGVRPRAIRERVQRQKAAFADVKVRRVPLLEGPRVPGLAWESDAEAGVGGGKASKAQHQTGYTNSDGALTARFVS